MTALYTIDLTHPDGRAPLYAMTRPAGWKPEWDGLLTMFPERAGLFDETGVREWMAASKAVGAGFKAHVRIAGGDVLARAERAEAAA